MDRLETRELAHFLAVADELHFGRAAARLGIAQPALSKTIRQLERRLGLSLFERTSRSVALTPAGEVLAGEARHALDVVSAAVRRTQRAASPDPRLVLAMKPGGDAGLLPAILAAYHQEPQSVPVRVIFGDDRARLLHDGHADAALLYSPPDDVRGLDTQPLLTGPATAVLVATHPLAARSSVRIADIPGDKLHRRPTDTADVGSISELMQIIALGQKIAVLPQFLTTPLRDDLVTVPVSDIPATTLLLAWPTHSTSPAVAALARAADTVTVPSPG
ncbi:LysR family transcriptional regulator [Actinocrispum wychmicini]|uniref:DNA-binding transcriptional LysR family regulator n=1 Tax=Actinocrispum wychmicini TaxID=1213861 RepID=A0A4R2JH74_9PSEU|nr:LysR family transcriptional regulator [Actinocrispum wychmicini]TCO59171.1 DNA-binding transcriptional LysR family regulator [Actinocrispum wychmicini]